MNTYNINDKNIDNLLAYQNFIKNNEGVGYLKIRAYGASEAVPIEGMNIEVSTLLGDNTRLVFFDDKTDASGMIEKLELPAPKEGSDNLIAPSKTVYDIKANYDGIEENFKVNLYDGICVQQIISVVPNTLVRGLSYGD